MLLFASDEEACMFGHQQPVLVKKKIGKKRDIKTRREDIRQVMKYCLQNIQYLCTV